jgi:hypothetical protein
MIDAYSAIMIARAEHEQMTRSLAPVSDYGSPMQASPRGWLSKHVAGWLCAVGNGLASLGERLTHARDTALEAPLTRPEPGGG